MEALEEKYDLELEKVVKRIKDENAKKVCLQFADGLRPLAKKAADLIEKESGAETFLWMGSCFGACDTPIGLEKMKFDMIIQWGHARWSWL